MNVFFLAMFLSLGILLGLESPISEGSRVSFQGETGTVLSISSDGYCEVDIDGEPSSWFIWIEDLDKL